MIRSYWGLKIGSETVRRGSNKHGHQGGEMASRNFKNRGFSLELTSDRSP